MRSDTFSELTSLRSLSSRIGQNPLLVQAATGNTSIKSNEILWIKASGQWLAHADRENIFVPVDLGAARTCIQSGQDPADCAAGASVETAMHAVIPHRVVLHVHSVNAIAWAVRRDTAALAERLNGLRWQWVPYRTSGIELAREIGRTPAATVFVLANHGLVICGEDCESAERLLQEVELRLRLEPRALPEPGNLHRSAFWRLPGSAVIHSLATDPISRTILGGGVLYPCQAIFLRSEEFRLVPGEGVLIGSSAASVVEATLSGLAEVLRRIDDPASVRYFSEIDVENLRRADIYRYRAMVESVAGASFESPNGHTIH